MGAPRLAAHGELAAHRESFVAVCKCLDTILLCKRRLLAPADAAPRLRNELAAHMAAHKAVYGGRLVRPKHHWNMDVPDQLARDARILDAFIIERIHLQVKWVAETVTNTTTFELSVLAGVTNVAFTRSRDCTNLYGGLVGRTAPVPGFPAALLADHLEHHGLKISSGDVVLSGHTAGKVLACLRENAALYAMIEVWQRTSVLSEHSDVWVPSACRTLLETTAVSLPIAWYALGDGSFVVVRM